MSANSNMFVMECEARCEGRCVCSETNLFVMTSVRETQENTNTEGSTESLDSIASRAVATANRSRNGITSVLRNRYRRLEEEDTRCLCHEKPKPTDRKSRNKLIAACMIVFVFMIGEVVGKVMNMIG